MLIGKSFKKSFKSASRIFYHFSTFESASKFLKKINEKNHSNLNPTKSDSNPAEAS